jgi:hypothetical protein
MATNPTPKTFTYHVYKNGSFKGLLTNVISDFSFPQEINSAGSTVTIRLAAAADSYSEGSLVDFNNQIQVYVIDGDSPNGSLIFTGFITNYMPVFTDDNKEYVDLTVMGYGATFSDYIIEAGETIDVNGNSQNGSTTGCTGNFSGPGTNTVVIQSFQVGAGVTKLSAVEFVIACNTNDDFGNSVLAQVYSSQTDAQGTTTGTPIASATLPITSLTAANYKFTFASFASVTAGNTYWVRLTYVYSDHTTGGIGDPGYAGKMVIYYDSSNLHGSGILETVVFTGSVGGAVTVIAGAGAYIKTYSGTGSTQAAYSSQDPSAILKSIIDNYNSQGGPVTYTPSSIDLTGTTVSYTFNTNTVLEGINQVLTLAPAGWYWYVDQATNVLHFHKQSLTAQSTLALGKNIKNLSVEKRAQDIVNVVYFVGGPIAGVNLYQKYTLQSSINLYGRHAMRYTDNNVTLAATAQIIANSILTNQGQIELRIEMDILDNAGDSTSILGFDLESLTLGQTISFRSFGPGSGGTLWDVALWDVAKWDFDITDLSSVVVQITRKDYKPDVLHLSLSTVPPDITKRVQDIYRNLTQLNTLNNPAIPS